jgi:membrane dipeptidase
LFFFDLHCDTITECHSKDKSLFDSDCHISICKAKHLNRWVQLYAIWMPDEHRGGDALNYFDAVYERFKNEVAENSLYIKQCMNSQDLDDCLSQGKAAAILSVEGGSALAGSLDRIDYIFSSGVKLITLTWNASNELGCGCLVKNGGGLTAFGKQALRKINELKIVADVSHLNRKGFWDAADLSSAPFVASHSTCAAILEKWRKPSDDKYFSLLRSLDDEQIKFIADTGGLIGINFCGSFLGDKGDDGFEAVYRHMSHILDIGGEDVLAIGSDFDGCDINAELAGIDKIPDLARSLERRGMDKKLLNKIFFDNAYSFFKAAMS